MHLYRIVFDKSSLLARQHYWRPHRFHGVLMAAFEGASHGFSDKGRVLFRMEQSDTGQIYALIQCASPFSDETAFAPYGNYQIEAKTIDTFLKLVAAEKRDFRFRMAVNPVKTVQTNDGNGRRRIPLTNEDDVLIWLSRHGINSGFELRYAAIKRSHKVPGKTETEIVNVVTIEGLLSTTNPQKMGEAILKGIGKAKIFGCGLISLAA